MERPTFEGSARPHRRGTIQEHQRGHPAHRGVAGLQGKGQSAPSSGGGPPVPPAA